MDDKVDIRPSLGDILNGYQRLSYKPETAIAEFVDNSTASYYQNRAILKMLGQSLYININYNPSFGVLSIEDNAWGMDKKTFADALTIAKRPVNQAGRNEYGMGLKTAASWFGKKWTVITKTRGTEEEYRATIDIDELMKNKKNEINITTRKANKELHYTIIRITNLSRRIQNRTIEKLKDELSSIYRKDINSGDITIAVNDLILNYELPAVYKETVDGVEKIWRKDFTDSITFDGKKYGFNGFVALLNEGSYSKTGFALLRRGRVIDKSFKPQEIFKAANSFQSLRIFGEVHLDNWPVTQAKDAFDWDLDGLKEEFISKLSELVDEYIIKAKTVRKKDKETQTTVTLDDVKDIADETYDDLKSIKEIKVAPKNDIVTSAFTNEDNKLIPSYTTTVHILHNTYHIKVEFISDMEAELVTVEEDKSNKQLLVTFNAAHPYFIDIKDKEGFTKVFQKYLILHIIAEKYLERVSANEGMIYPYEIRETINRMLEEIKNSDGDEIFT